MAIERNAPRVLMVVARYFPYIGGTETHVYEVGRRLARAGINITVLTTDPSGQLPPFEEYQGMKIRRVQSWPANKDYYFAPAIYREITSGSWDLVHCQGYHNLVPPLAMLAARRARLPFILSFHSGGDVSRFRKTFRGLQWMALRPLLLHAKKLIAVSDFEADFFQKHLRLPAGQFVVIPNGASLSEAKEPTTGEKREAGDEPLIVSVGRLERYKGHQRIIAALPKVLEQIPHARLRIAGSGPYEAVLWKMARDLDVAQHVEIRAVPSQDRQGMASLLTQANLITLLSEYESQGIAAMEALALRRPVLVARTSALQELASRNLAYAVPLTSTPEEVAGAVIRQLHQPLIPGIVELPTWDACAASLLALYQTILGRIPLPCAS